ncbi:hypothetical protein NQ318_005604 [Aromia moschata]|uniref:THAP-type domain-containing protein n=1 Tax=Aromia moschata TaxID=1265417 RepID=A0AAV8XVA0_9CUCU|nr:hypothetical protein NQ318_005604 [Aromia moschata]
MDRRDAWIIKLRMGRPVSKFMRVCCLHFAEDDYFYRSKDSKKRRILKKTAVPSRKLPLQYDIMEKKSSRTHRTKKKVCNEIDPLDITCSTSEANIPCTEYSEDDKKAAKHC